MNLALKEEGMDSPEDCGVVCCLASGDIHLCRKMACKHTFLTEDKFYVCQLSGLVVGNLCVRDDFSTGRVEGSANPDDTAGEPVGGSWRQKKDMVALSDQACVAATDVDDEQFIKFTKPERKRQTQKRGARCVDEPEEVEQQRPTKRSRQIRGMAESRETFSTLCNDVESTITKLVNFDRRADCKSSKERRERFGDPTKLDYGGLLKMALRRYSKECLSLNLPPSLDAIHNIALLTRRIAQEQQRKNQTAVRDCERANAALLLKVRTRNDVATLVVKLWQAACNSPHMDSGRRTNDSFRPFVCGVLYAFKRGVALPDGRLVVPACPELAAALPVLRATAVASQAKSLHASSHRGLCTLHRAIASCDTGEVGKIFSEPVRLARQLSENLKLGLFDVV